MTATRFNVYADLSHKGEIDAYAASHGMSTSGYMVATCLEALRAGKRPDPSLVPKKAKAQKGGE